MNVTKLQKTVLCFLFLVSVAISTVIASGISERRAPEKDVEKELGRKLTKEENDLVDFVLVYYNARYGYDIKDSNSGKAADRMTDEEYQNAIRQSTKVVKNPVSRGLLSAGKKGEKILKALIVKTEDAAKATGDWVDKNAAEYDKRRKD